MPDDNNICFGSISFKCISDDIQIENYTINHPDNIFHTITIYATEGNLTINAKFSLTDNLYDYQIINKALSVCENILNIISFILNTSIQSLHYSGSSISRPGELTRVSAEVTASHCIEGAPKEIDTHADIYINKILSSNFINNEFHLTLWRSAQNRSDVVAKYLLLYSILVDIYINQKDIDAIILYISPSTPISISPNNPKYFESIYTKIRNELLHRRTDVDINKTINELTKHITEFEKIVKQALLDRLIP